MMDLKIPVKPTCSIDNKECDAELHNLDYDCHIQMSWMIAPCCCSSSPMKHKCPNCGCEFP